MYIYIYIYTHNIYIYTHICIYTCMYAARGYIHVCIYTCMYTYMYIYIYIYITLPSSLGQARRRRVTHTANLHAKILDFGGFDSNRILMLRGGILMSVGILLEVLNQRILVGIILVGRLGVPIEIMDWTYPATNLSRDNLSKGDWAQATPCPPAREGPGGGRPILCRAIPYYTIL